MNELNIQLTRKQQELLLRGLRFVRSSVSLEVKDWSEEVEAERHHMYGEIRQLEAMLNGAKIIESATV